MWWNIGFCAWHRQYLRAFEKDLQTQVPGVTLPYWDWTAQQDPRGLPWTDDLLGPNGDPAQGYVVTRGRQDPSATRSRARAASPGMPPGSAFIRGPRLQPALFGWVARRLAHGTPRTLQDIKAEYATG